MNELPEELCEYQLFTCDYAEPRNTNYTHIKSFDDRESALKYASEILGLKLAHELYEFEIVKRSNKVKINELYKMKKQFIQFENEKLELINNIKLCSEAPPDLESKTISELMRIYYATIDDKCPQCGNSVGKLPFIAVYRSNAS